MLFNMESDNTKEEPYMNHRKTKAGPEEKTEVKNKSAEMENKYGRTAAVGDNLKAVPIAKGLAEVSKSKTVQHRRAKARPQELVGQSGLDWTGQVGLAGRSPIQRPRATTTTTCSSKWTPLPKK